MKSIYVRLLLPMLTMALMLVAAGGFSSPPVSAEDHESEEGHSDHSDDEDHSHDDESNADDNHSHDDSDVSGNSYVAADCQNLTVIVRADINSRAASLNARQRVAAETWATQDLGAYQIDVGQSITVSESVVTAAIARAEALTEAQQEAWAPYARQVDDFAATLESGTVSDGDGNSDGSDESDPEDTDQPTDNEAESDDNAGSQEENDTDSNEDESDQTDDSESDESNADSDSDQDASEDEDDDEASESSSNLPWVAAAIVAGAGWVFLRRREANSKK